MEGHCWKVPQYRKARVLFQFFTERGTTKSGVRNEEGWLKRITATFQKFLKLHYHSWLIKTETEEPPFRAPPVKEPRRPPCCGLIEESKSMEFLISEETRQDPWHIKSYKWQPGITNRNRPLWLRSSWVCIYWRRERQNQEQGESCQDVTGVKQIDCREWHPWLCGAGRPAVGSVPWEHLRHGLRAPTSILNWIPGFSAIKSCCIVSRREMVGSNIRPVWFWF